MNLLAIVSSMDLSFNAAGIPVFWQLLKGFHDSGTSVIVMTREGTSFTTPWWRIYPRPFFQRKTVDFALNRGNGFTQAIVKRTFYRSWRRALNEVFAKESIDVVLFCDAFIVSSGVASWIRKTFSVPVIYYETDIQKLPKYSLDHHPEKHRFPDYSGCDAIVCSFEKISEELREHGLQNVWTVPFGADPDFFKPIQRINKDIDVYFSGYSSLDREDWIGKMISKPSQSLSNSRFLVEGVFNIGLGNAERITGISLDKYLHFCCRSKINLNILRQQFITAGVLNSRIFELASLGCCVVSNPSDCLKDFFEINREIIVVNDEMDAIEKYKWLLSSEEDRNQIGNAARQRILREHTYEHRAQQILGLIEKLKN